MPNTSYSRYKGPEAQKNMAHLELSRRSVWLVWSG